MPCEVVLIRVDFFKMASVAMETAKMLKKLKTQNHSRLLAEQKLMKLDRNEMERDKPKYRNRFDKLCRSCHGQKRGDLKTNWIPFIKLHEAL